MRLSLVSLAAALILGATTSAHADNLVYYNFTASGPDVTSSGTFAFETGANEVVKLYAVDSFGTTFDSRNDGAFPNTDGYPTVSDYRIDDVYGGNYVSGASYDLPEFQLAIYSTGGTFAVCVQSSSCEFDSEVIDKTAYANGDEATNSTYVFTSGTVTPAPVTPEPSSLVLLGTGVFSVAGAARRRFFKR